MKKLGEGTYYGSGLYGNLWEGADKILDSSNRF
jgi:hypothetical protein